MCEQKLSGILPGFEEIPHGAAPSFKFDRVEEHMASRHFVTSAALESNSLKYSNQKPPAWSDRYYLLIFSRFTFYLKFFNF